MQYSTIAIMGMAALLIMTTAPFALAATTATTTFTFEVPISRSITATYGGECSATAFFYNEVDADMDPDPDGNWMRARPRAVRNMGNTGVIDYNTNGLTNPSSTHRTFYTVNLSSLPSTGPATGTEVDTNTYTVISADDSDINVLKTTVSGRRSVMQGIFRTNVEKTRVKDLNFVFIGEAVHGDSCQDGTGTEQTITIELLNTETNDWDILKTIAGSGQSVVGVKDAQYGNIYLDKSSNVQKYVGFDRNVSFRIWPSPAFGMSGCLFIDQIKLRTTEYTVNNDFCQSSTLAPITITNAGNVSVNVDANFLTGFGGADVNLMLKAWMGTGTGCGSDGNGFGGWEKDCSISFGDPPTQTACTMFSTDDIQENHRMISNLPIGDTNQLCFSGETTVSVYGTTFVSGGDHNKTFQIGSDVSP